MNKSQSMNDIDLSSWKSNDFSNKDFWVNEEGNYGLQDLFSEEERYDDNIQSNEEEVQRVNIEKTKNQLNRIFRQQCGFKEPKKRVNCVGGKTAGALVKPGKRKSSSQPESSEEDPTRAACTKVPRLSITSTPRPRLQTVSNIKTGAFGKSMNKKRTKSLARDDPSQRLLTQLWNNNIRSLEEEEDKSCGSRANEVSSN